jgi:hypothetical protein
MGPKDPDQETPKLRLNCLEPRRDAMYKSLIAIPAALIILSAGSLVSDRAEAGASASAPTKYSKASFSAYQTWTAWRARRATGTSEYSASSKSRKR